MAFSAYASNHISASIRSIDCILPIFHGYKWNDSVLTVNTLATSTYGSLPSAI